MRLRRRAPGLGDLAAHAMEGYEHLDAGTLGVLAWLVANEVDFVLVGAVAQRLRGQRQATGPVAIVPAPYHRNYSRLANALAAAHPRLRAPADADGKADMAPVKLTPEKLAGGQRWQLRCGGAYDIDIEPVRTRAAASARSATGYEELLYESARVEPVAGVTVEVASPEDIEDYAQGPRAGGSPGIAAAGAEPPAGEMHA
jgi:hypothetical protein